MVGVPKPTGRRRRPRGSPPPTGPAGELHPPDQRAAFKPSDGSVTSACQSMASMIVVLRHRRTHPNLLPMPQRVNGGSSPQDGMDRTTALTLALKEQDAFLARRHLTEIDRAWAIE